MVISDAGFDGLVIKVELEGWQTVSRPNKQISLAAAAGEDWDALVCRSVMNLGLGGLECLSGIPGSVGASPVQNIGAYGQEVAQTIESVECLDRNSLDVYILPNSECNFSYRTSIFKEKYSQRLIILKVNFLLSYHYTPQITYAELEKHIQYKKEQEEKNLVESQPPSNQLEQIRQAVLELRARKGMLITSNLHSVGSFFKNPIVTKLQYKNIQEYVKKKGLNIEIPNFTKAEDKVKISAAWLIEHCGFHKGLRKLGVGLSPKHTLALVNYNGSTKELLSLAVEIEGKVKQVYGIHLEREPVVVGKT